MPDDRWASYERTVVEILLSAGGSLTVRSARDRHAARWPWPTGQAVHILTAWDPGPERPGRDSNRVRQAALESYLARLALPLLATVGVDPATGRREEGVAVIALPESDALALGARYGQEAIFAWTPGAWTIVGCNGGRRLASGWSLVVPQPGFHFSPATDAPI